MRTTALFSLRGFSKAKTAKAILFEDMRNGYTAWIPTSVASVRYLGLNYKVEVVVPDWFYRKIVWKAPVIVKNPFAGVDIGNLMEEKMVLEEILAGETDAVKIDELKSKLAMIDEAAAEFA